MQRSKFVTSLSVHAICRMMRNHLCEAHGWFPERDIEHVETDSHDFVQACPVDDLNHLLTIKRYIQWAEKLESDKAWTVDIHDLITTHAYVLNLDLEPLGHAVTKEFATLNELKTKEKILQAQENKLAKERLALGDEIEKIHVKLFKKKIFS